MNHAVKFKASHRKTKPYKINPRLNDKTAETQTGVNPQRVPNINLQVAVTKAKRSLYSRLVHTYVTTRTEQGLATEKIYAVQKSNGTRSNCYSDGDDLGNATPTFDNSLGIKRLGSCDIRCRSWLCIPHRRRGLRQ